LQALRNNVHSNSPTAHSSTSTVEIAITASLNSAMAISCAVDQAIAYSEASGGVSAIGSTTTQGSSGLSTAITGTHVVRLAHTSMKGRNGCLWSSNPIGSQSVQRSVRNLVTAKPGPVNSSASL